MSRGTNDAVGMSADRNEMVAGSIRLVICDERN